MRLDRPADRVGRTLADLAVVQIDAAHARLRGERHERRGQRLHVALAQIETVFREHDDAAAFRRFVGERGELRGVGQFLFAHAGGGNEQRGLPIAERDRAGLVEQQHVDVARGLDGAARGRDHVGLHHAAHAGHADRRQQRADGRRDQADEQRDERGDRDDVAHLDRLDAEHRERQQGRGREQQHHGQRDQQDRQRDLVGGAAALGAFDHRDHAVEEGFARVHGHADHDPVGEQARAAGHRREVAARFADHRRGFARDRRLVDRGHAFDHFTVGGNRIAGFDEHDVALAQIGGGGHAHAGVAARFLELLGHDVALGAAQRRGLGLGPAFGERFGKVREQHREPQPERDREDEAGRRFGVARERGDPQDGRQDAADIHAEHHRIAELRARRQLPERIDDRRLDERGVEHRTGARARAGFFLVFRAGGRRRRRRANLV